jgi:hypothetical protein
MYRVHGTRVKIGPPIIVIWAEILAPDAAGAIAIRGLERVPG